LLVNWADYTILVVLGLSVVMGLWRGLIAEVLAVGCWVAAFWVAWLFGEALSEKFTGVSLPSVRLALGYAACFFGVLVVGTILAFVMRKLIAGSGLTGTDRLLGMMFGLARGVLLVMLAVLIFGLTPLPRDAWWHESRLLPSFQAGAEWLGTLLPESAKKYLDFRRVLPSLPMPPATSGASTQLPEQTTPQQAQPST
jgi:membrane protein required for colicin V production